MRTTVRLDDALASHVNAVRQDADDSDAEAVRECIRRSQELDACREELAQVEQELERVRREKRLILDERDEKQELARYAATERELAQERRQAPLWTRAKWWIVGRGEE